MDESTVIEMLRKRKGDRTLAVMSDEMKVSIQYLHEVLNGKKPPSAKVLAYLGLERTIVRAR